MSRVKTFAVNVALLTGAALLMKAIALGFNVYVSNKLGGAGMGLFTLIMTVYGFAATFATSGVNLASTRLAAEALGKDSDAAVRDSMKRCIVYGLLFGCAACTVLLAVSEPVGVHLLDDARSVTPLRVLALSLPFVSLSSALGGYFNAVRRVAKSVSSQLFSQLIRIFVTAFLLSTVMPDGIGYACLSVAAGASVSEAASCIYLIAMYTLDLRRHNVNSGDKGSHMNRRLISIAMPVALSAYVRSGLLTVEHLLIPYGLRKSGSTGESAIASYGVLHGMAMPVVLFPMAFLSSFAGMLVPELAEERVRGNYARINYIVSRVWQITLIFSIGCAGFMIAASGSLGTGLYNNPEASGYIRIMAPLIPVMYLDHVTDGMLKGLGEQLYSMRVNIVDSFISCILVWLLLPVSGVNGYVVIIFLCELLNTALSVVRLMSVAEVKISVIRSLLLPLLCIAGSTSVVNIMSELSHMFVGSGFFDITVRCVSSLILYLLFLRITGAVNKDDIQWIKGIVMPSGVKTQERLTAVPFRKKTKIEP